MNRLLYFAMMFLSVYLLITDSSAMGKTKKPNVEHWIEYSNKGTRSEARSGYLRVDGYLVPDNFMTVIVGDKAYKFYMRKYLWGNDGYFPDKDSDITALCPEIAKALTEEEISQGWAIVKGRPFNTPINWIYVIWKDGTAVVSPEKLIEFIERNHIPPLPRNLMIEGLKK
ncbi:MAG: hypothetical protein WBK20_09260 [Spirochaetota bacterium]